MIWIILSRKRVRVFKCWRFSMRAGLVLYLGEEEEVFSFWIFEL